MNARPKKKMCWNCEGSVSLKAETCPYCGVSVVGLSQDISPEPPEPPYKLVNAAQEQSIPVSPYAEDFEDAPILDEEEPLQGGAEAVAQANPDDSKQVVLVLSLLMGGAVSLIFGFALLIFAQEGVLTLQWNAAYWYVYLLFAFPLLYFGFRKLNSLSS